MAHLTFNHGNGYGKYGDDARDKFSYSQSVKIGNIVECSGQGGWDRETLEIPRDLPKQIEQAFENVDATLKAAGAPNGWKHVYNVRSYHLPANDEALELMVKGFKKWMPDHQPIWTMLGVQRLGIDDMRVEIEVKAHVE